MATLRRLYTRFIWRGLSSLYSCVCVIPFHVFIYTHQYVCTRRLQCNLVVLMKKTAVLRCVEGARCIFRDEPQQHFYRIPVKNIAILWEKRIWSRMLLAQLQFSFGCMEILSRSALCRADKIKYDAGVSYWACVRIKNCNAMKAKQRYGLMGINAPHTYIESSETRENNM